MFKGIEGARAWLAWIVVASHLASIPGLSSVVHAADLIEKAGHHAVGVFIIISGFVITHLLMTKQEPYGKYIVRRALRIYPAYLVCLVLGIVASGLTFDAILAQPTVTDQALRHVSARAVEYQTHFWPHLIAHLTLLHGVIPNNLLDESQYMFLGPAWSLSLEWQFYLVAPFVVAALQGKRRLMVVGLMLAGLVAYRAGIFGKFYNPSILFGAGHFFLLGIATRMVADKLPRFQTFPFAAVAACLALVLVSKNLIPLVGWIALAAYFQTERKWWILDGPVAEWAGSRSYSVYIVHQPVIYLAIWAFQDLAFWPKFAAVVLTTVPTVILLAEGLYRFVERPGIALGRKLTRREPIRPAVV